MITDLGQIDTKTDEGKLLMAALCILTTNNYTDKTPDEVIAILNARVEFMFQDESIHVSE